MQDTGHCRRVQPYREAPDTRANDQATHHQADENPHSRSLPVQCSVV